MNIFVRKLAIYIKQKKNYAMLFKTNHFEMFKFKTLRINKIENPLV